MASSALSRNGRLDGAGMARGPGLVGFAVTETDDRGASREWMHRGTRHGMSSLLITILTISSVFWIMFGMTRVSCERKLKYEYAPYYPEDQSSGWRYKYAIISAVRLTLFPAHSLAALESRAHTNPTSLTSLHGGTLSICPVFYGISRVDLLESVGGATLSGPEVAGRRMRCTD